VKTRDALALFVLIVAGLWMWRSSVDSPRSAAGLERGADVEGVARNIPGELRPAPGSAERSALKAVAPLPPRPAPAVEPELPEEEFEMEQPDDPIETGDCTLYLTLVERGSLRPVASWVTLYRLDAPANEFYEHGDQVQARLQVPETGLVIRDLPEDGYRLVVDQIRRAQGDPAAFEVRGRNTQHEVLIDLPREREAWLVLYDAAGRRIERASIQVLPTEARPRWPWEIRWVQGRACKLENVFEEVTSDAVDFGAPLPAAVERVAEAEGFRLTGLRESNSGETRVHVWRASLEGHTSVVVRITMDSEPPERLVGLIAPLDELEESIRLPSGEDVRSFPGSVSASSLARPASQLPPDDPWRVLVVDVRVAPGGYEPLEFRWQPAAGPPGVRVLKLRD